MITLNKVPSDWNWPTLPTMGLIAIILFSLTSCTEEKEKLLPTVIIVSITDITSNTAKITTKVMNEGSSTVTGTGACWGTSLNPDLSNNVSNIGAGLGEFISIPTNLAPNTTYCVRAFAINELGISYSSNRSFTTLD